MRDENGRGERSVIGYDGAVLPHSALRPCPDSVHGAYEFNLFYKRNENEMEKIPTSRVCSRTSAPVINEYTGPPFPWRQVPRYQKVSQRKITSLETSHPNRRSRRLVPCV